MKYEIGNVIIQKYQGPHEDREVSELLNEVYIGEGYTPAEKMDQLSSPETLRKRGDLILARSREGELLGTIICVLPTSPLRQLAKNNEAEVQLVAVKKSARGHGLSLLLLKACEQRAFDLGFSQIVLSTRSIMHAAQHSYEKAGYHRNPSRDWMRSDGSQFLVYEKFLIQ